MEQYDKENVPIQRRQLPSTPKLMQSTDHHPQLQSREGRPLHCYPVWFSVQRLQLGSMLLHLRNLWQVAPPHTFPWSPVRTPFGSI